MPQALLGLAVPTCTWSQPTAVAASGTALPEATQAEGGTREELGWARRVSCENQLHSALESLKIAL